MARTDNDAPDNIKSLVMGLLGKGGESAKKSRFEIGLDEMIAKQGSAVMGRVHLINLHDLIIKRKDAEVTLARAEKIAEGVINENFSEGDIFTRGADGAFYIVFANMTEAAGTLKCSVIADQIARLLAKEDSVFFKLEIDNTVKTVNRSTVKDARARATRGKGSASTELAEEQLRVKRERTRMEQAIDGATPRKAETLETPIPVSEPSAQVEANAIRPPPEDISVMYGTVWNVETSLLTAFICILMLREADGSVVRFKLQRRAEQYRRTLLAIDQFTQRKATAALRDVLGAGSKTLIILPVHYLTVDQDAPSLLYRQGLAGLSEDERRHVVLELVDLPHELSGVWAQKIVHDMRRIARTVTVRVAPDARNLDTWRDAGVHAVGFDLATFPTEDDTLLAVLETFAERAEENGLKSFVYGLESISAVTMAVSAGFDYVEGPAIRAPAESLDNIQPFETEDLLAHLIS